jgi:hypothetical protein
MNLLNLAGALVVVAIFGFVGWWIYEGRVDNQAEKRYWEAMHAANEQKRQDLDMGLLSTYCPPDCGRFSANRCSADALDYFETRAKIYQKLADATPKSFPDYRSKQIEVGDAWADIPVTTASC